MKRLIVLVMAVTVAAAIAVPAFAATAHVRVGDNFFRGKNVTVKKGSSVKWTWVGKAPHNVTVTRGPVRFRSTTKAKGSYTRKMTRRGTYSIVCTLHPGMEMKLTVR